jgi:hypothetical protein
MKKNSRTPSGCFQIKGGYDCSRLLFPAVFILPLHHIHRHLRHTGWPPTSSGQADQIYALMTYVTEVTTFEHLQTQ